MSETLGIYQCKTCTRISSSGTTNCALDGQNTYIPLKLNTYLTPNHAVLAALHIIIRCLILVLFASCAM